VYFKNVKLIWQIKSIAYKGKYKKSVFGKQGPVEPVVLLTPQWTHYLLTSFDSLPGATAQYQHMAITLRSCQLLKMGTWLPETC